MGEDVRVVIYSKLEGPLCLHLPYGGITFSTAIWRLDNGDLPDGMKTEEPYRLNGKQIQRGSTITLAAGDEITALEL